MLPESPLQARLFLLQKVIFPTAATLYKTQQPLHFPNFQPANALPPPTSWPVKCLVHSVRNLKCIFLKSILLYQLTSCQHFYF